MTTRQDDVPHTGSLIYQEGIDQIPAIAISTNDANLLSRLLRKEVIRVFMRNTSQNLEPKLSYNVVGEIRGSTNPDEILLVGGHLDSWDVGQGAHDDGAGCVQAMDVVHILKAMDYRPKRTLRCVLFMNEENGQGGAIAYRDSSFARNEYHMGAIESDRGGFTPRGFTCTADDSVFTQLECAGRCCMYAALGGTQSLLQAELLRGQQSRRALWQSPAPDHGHFQ